MPRKIEESDPYVKLNVFGCVHACMAWFASSLPSFLGLLLLSLAMFAHAAPAIKSVHVGLTPDYTRITLESNEPLQYELSMLDNPHRVIMDLRNVKLTPALNALPQKVDAIDPFVQKVRIGQFKSDVIRLVFDLKANVVPKTFVVAPNNNMQHRLVLDIYHPDKAGKIPDTARIDNMAGTDHDADVLEDLVTSLSQPVRQAKVQAAAPIPQSHQPPRTKPQVSPAKQSGNTASSKNQERKAATKVPRMLIVAIDAGHGGKDPGAVGSLGTHEKDVTLAIARKLKERIDKEPNMRAVLTRDGDYYISLQQRRINARRANASLFVSIHADANPKPHAHGSSVFTLSEHGASSTTASWLANKENSVDNDLMGGIDITTKSKDIKELLLDLSVNATINDSVKLAEQVLKQLGDVNHLHKRQVEQAGFAVLKSPDIPSILVETAFLSNPREEEKLRNHMYQNKLADAVFSGIKSYFIKNPAIAQTEMARVK